MKITREFRGFADSGVHILKRDNPSISRFAAYENLVRRPSQCFYHKLNTDLIELKRLETIVTLSVI